MTEDNNKYPPYPTVITVAQPSTMGKFAKQFATLAPIVAVLSATVGVTMYFARQSRAEAKSESHDGPTSDFVVDTRESYLAKARDFSPDSTLANVDSQPQQSALPAPSESRENQVPADCIRITNIKNGNVVGTEEVIKGEIKHLESKRVWVVARRSDFSPLLYLQRQATFSGVSAIEGNATFGEPRDKGYPFDVGFVVVSESEHLRLMASWTASMQSGDFRPIAISRPLCGTSVRVKKA